MDSPPSDSAGPPTESSTAEEGAPTSSYPALITIEDPPTDYEQLLSCRLSDPSQSLGVRNQILVTKDPSKDLQWRKTYASFGDNGTTATVNAFGNIMQISSFLGHGHSGFFCLDQRNTPEPCFVRSRMHELADLIEKPRAGLRLCPEKDAQTLWQGGRGQPVLEFVNDRWPRFTFPPSRISQRSKPSSTDQSHGIDRTEAQSQGLKLSIQYYSRGGTIFQQYVWERADPEGLIPQAPTFTFNLDLLIRDLDFVDWTYRFNEEYQASFISGYVFVPVPHRKSVILAHELVTPSEFGFANQGERAANLDSNDEAPPVAASLIVMAFSDGVAQEIEVTEHRYTYEITLSQETKEKFRTSGRLEITMGYRLQTMSAKERWLSSVIPMADLTEMMNLFPSGLKLPFGPDLPLKNLRFSSEEHLDFIIRRNLEHILSVCSIPLPHLSREGTVIPTALTCGDLSGHRTATSASFFAFQFLLSTWKYIDDEDKAPREYLSDPRDCICEGETLCIVCTCMENSRDALRKRILDTCRGHIYWVCAAESTDSGFAPNYWVTGNKISDLGELPLPTLIDTPLQILKVSDFLTDSSIPYWLSPSDDVVDQNFRSKIRPWIKGLDEMNVHGKYVFSCRDLEEEKKFRLADHVWICRAIQGIEALGLDEELSRSRSEAGTAQNDQLLNEYHSSHIKRLTLKRFTAENSATKQRMIATCRTPSKTRFLFHAKDTALFHAMASGFFSVENGKAKEFRSRGSSLQNWETNWRYMYDGWKKTVEVQSAYSHYQHFDWEKPQWYALVILMSSQGQKVSALPSGEALASASTALFSASAINGLFPGLLDQDRGTVPFRDGLDHDSYWQAAFETPYILWTQGKSHLEAQLDREQSRKAKKLTTLSGHLAPTNDARRTAQGPAKTEPFTNFNNVIGRTVLVEGSDDWLLDAPSALGFDFRPRIADLFKFWSVDEDTMAEAGAVIEAAIRSPKQLRVLLSMDKIPKGVIVNVGKRSHGRELDQRQMSNAEIASGLEERRTAQKSKKRLLWIPSGDKATALLCYLASPTSEREAMSKFFDRHANYDKYFFESTNGASNVWETELHLSFFRLVDDDPLTDEGGIPDKTIIEMPKLQNHSAPGKTITRAVKSFRFIGDFCDRNWTCHFFEHGSLKMEPSLQSRLSNLSLIRRNLDEDSKAYKRTWQQRKVLELLMLNEILEDIFYCTNEIWGWVQESLRPEQNKNDWNSSTVMVPKITKVGGMIAADSSTKSIFNGITFLSQVNSENYISISERWRFFDQLLQIFEDDLGENLARIDEWNRREKDRHPQQPRWTQNDEETYRAAIIKLSVLNQGKVRDLNRLRTSMRTFRDPLNVRLASIRDDMSFRGSQNTNIFTYVTVVFLPLGFATGIFSTSGPPANHTLGFMVITAFVALFATIFALANAKLLGKTMVKPAIDLICRHGLPVVYCSLFVVYTGLIVVFFIRAVLHLVFYPIFEYAAKPFLAKLENPENIKSYKTQLVDRVRGCNLVKEIQNLYTTGQLKKMVPRDVRRMERSGDLEAEVRRRQLTQQPKSRSVEFQRRSSLPNLPPLHTSASF